MAQYPEEGCGGCSFYADQLAHLAHLRARDTNFVAVSRAPQEHIRRFKERMGWDFPWYTTTDDFSEDFGVGEWHGTNVFLRDDEDRIFRTYFVNNRGDEAHGEHLELPRHHPVRPPGGVGGLARGLPAGPALPVVELPRQVRGGGVIAHVSGLPLEEALPAVIVAAPPLLARLRMWRRARA